MQVKEIMSTNIQIVMPDTFIQEVARKMQLSDCGSVLVASDDKLVGVITDRDLAIRCVAESHDPEKTTASKVMTESILYCRDTDDVEEVAHNMGKNKVRRLAVLDKNKQLVGIVSLGDIAKHSTEQHHLMSGMTLGEICSTSGKHNSETKRWSTGGQER